jgi:hypothetical protein
VEEVCWISDIEADLAETEGSDNRIWNQRVCQQA